MYNKAFKSLSVSLFGSQKNVIHDSLISHIVAHLLNHHELVISKSNEELFDGNLPSPFPFIMLLSTILSFMTAFFTMMIASLPSTLPEYSVSSSLDYSLPTDSDNVGPDHPQVNGISSGSDDLVQDDGAAGSKVSLSGSGKQDITGSGGSVSNSGNLIASTDGTVASTDSCGDAQTNKRLRMRVFGGVCKNRQASSQSTNARPTVIDTSPTTDELTLFSIPFLNKDPDKGCSDDKKLIEQLCCFGKIQQPGWAFVQYYTLLYHCAPFGESFSTNRSVYLPYSLTVATSAADDKCPAANKFCCQEYHVSNVQSTEGRTESMT